MKNKANYWLRNIPPTLCYEFCDQFNELLLETFRSFIGTPLDSKTIEQLRVDIKFGGFGLTDSHITSPAAYIASCMNSLSDIYATFSQSSDFDHIANSGWFQELTFHAADFNISVDDLIASTCTTNMIRQHDLTNLSHERVAAEFHADSESATWQQSRKNSIKNSFSGAWLNALPRQGTTYMSNEEFKTACLFRLGLPLPSISTTLRCDCTKAPYIGIHGEHFHCCPKGSSRIQKHNLVLQTVANLCSSANIQIILEPKNLFPTNIKAIKPDLLLRSPNLFQSGGEKDITLDVSITHPATSTNMTSQKSDSIEGSSADRTFSSKNLKFREIASQHDFNFMPIIFETYGHVHSTSLSFLNAIITKSASFHEVPRTIMKNYWIKRLSAALQIGQARLLISKTQSCIEAYTKKSLPCALDESISSNAHMY